MNKVVLGTIAANAFIGIVKSNVGSKSKSFMETGQIIITVSDRYDVGTIKRDGEEEKPLVMTKEDILDCISRIKSIHDHIEENGREWFAPQGGWGNSSDFFNFAGFVDFDWEGWDVSYYDVEPLILPSDVLSFEQHQEGGDMIVKATFAIPIDVQTMRGQLKQFIQDIHILFQIVLAHLSTKIQNKKYVVTPSGTEYCEYNAPVILESNPREDKFPLEKNIKTAIRIF